MDDPLSIFKMKTLPKGFESWNFMIKCHHLVCNYLTRDVGKGDEALFWEDSWDGHPPLHHSSFPKDLKEKLINLWGSKFCEYKIEVIS